MKKGALFIDVVKDLAKDLKKAQEEGIGSTDISQTWEYSGVIVKLTIIVKEGGVK